MSTYFVVRLRTDSAPEGLEASHAEDQLGLNTRGRPSELSRSAQLESRELAEALLEASREPILARCCEGTELLVEEMAGDENEVAQRIAADSDAVREWLTSQPAEG